MHFRLLGTNGFHAKAKTETFTAAGFALSLEPEIWKFHVVIWQATSKNCTKKLAAGAARLLFSFNQ